MTDVTVISATIGHVDLRRAVLSVLDQTCDVNHVVVVDGSQFDASVRHDIESLATGTRAPRMLVLPERTGHDGWCSHRIYAAMPFLVNTPYICFLDQDNWYEPDHVASLLSVATAANSRAAYSLRTVHAPDGAFICRDDCQSLGLLHESFDTPGKGHVDTNCWLLSRELAVALAPFWYQARTGDRRFARQVMDVCPTLPCSRHYSLHYTVSSRADSAPGDYFIRGNRVMRSRHPEGLPWEPLPSPASGTSAPFP